MFLETLGCMKIKQTENLIFLPFTKVCIEKKSFINENKNKLRCINHHNIIIWLCAGSSSLFKQNNKSLFSNSTFYVFFVVVRI